MKTKPAYRFILALALAVSGSSINLHAQRYAAYPAGDDSASSLGQFRLVVDGAWVDIMDAALAGSIFTTTEGLPGVWIYDGGVFTSPVLFDPATVVGRSDGFVSGSPPDTNGVIAGRAPGRTLLADNQLLVKPSWLDATGRVYEVHTFLKSLHLTDALTTQLGFSVKAGMLTPTRPVSAGEVEAYSTNSDFPARSFFNVYVQVDIPAAGPLPAIQLVNVDPLLVENAVIYGFPPRAFYIHGNTNAVSVYFNTDVTITNANGTLTVPRGTLFGQLTLAGHGMNYSEYEIPSFETEMEAEMQSSMPVNANPFPSVFIQDFSPNYALSPPAILTNPGSVTVNEGDTASFVAAASGGLPPSWQWYWNQTNLLVGEIHDTLALPNVQYAQRGGYFVIVTDAAGAATSALAVLTVNRLPVAPSSDLGAIQDQPAVFDIDKLLGRASDPDGDPVSFVSASATSTNGGTVTPSATTLTYMPPPGYVGQDLWTYTVTDGRGGLATGSVLVRVSTSSHPANNLIGCSGQSDGVHVRLAGIPGLSYQLQCSTNLISWAVLQTVTAGPNGLIEFIDSNPPATAGFYRTQAP